MNPPLHKSSTGDFFPELDGVRGFAVLSVVIYHLAYFNPTSPIQNVLFSFTKSGFMGVPVFFVLSGFLISYTIVKSQVRFDPAAYALRRAAKILPPFVISLVLFSFLALIWNEPKNVWLSAAAYLLTLPNFTSGWDGINPVYWSLMVEIHFYIIFPLIFFLLRKFSTRAELWCLLAFLVIPTTIRLLTHMPLDTPKDDWFANAQVFPRALDNFTLGILFTHFCINKDKYQPLLRRSVPISYVGVAVLIASYFLCAALNFSSNIERLDYHQSRLWTFEIFRLLPALGTFLLLFSVFSPKHTIVNKILLFAPLQYTGLISYEWFLLHYPPARFLGRVFGQADGSVGVYLSKTLLPFLVTFVASALLYRFISKPVMNWAKKIHF